jgi:DNA gyrase subunit A
MDRIIGVELTDGSSEIGLVTTAGMLIRFSEQEVRPMGLVAAGVLGIKLSDTDTVCDVFSWHSEGDIILISSIGRVWRMNGNEFQIQGRYGQGLAACKLIQGEKLVGASMGEKTETFTCHFTKSVSKQAKVGSIPLARRLGAGTKFAEVRGTDALVELSMVVDGLKFWQPRIPARKIRKTSSSAPKKPVQGKLL